MTQFKENLKLVCDALGLQHQHAFTKSLEDKLQIIKLCYELKSYTSVCRKFNNIQGLQKTKRARLNRDSIRKKFQFLFQNSSQRCWRNTNFWSTASTIQDFFGLLITEYII